MKKLIVNADDFGLVETVNQAIIDAYNAGVLSSTTLMVNTAGTAQAVNLAKLHAGLGVGLHFNLTLGAPICEPSNIPSLLDSNGGFFSRKRLSQKLLMGRVKRIEIERELMAQYARMQSFQLVPTHIDSHQHIHAFAQVFDVMAALCKRERIAMRSLKILNVDRSQVPIGRRLRQGLLQLMLNRNERRWPKGVNCNSDLASVFDLGRVPPVLTSEHYKALLGSTSGDVVELMVHPATEPESLAGLTRIGHISVAEYEYLMSNALLDVAHEAGFRLRNFSNAWNE